MTELADKPDWRTQGPRPMTEREIRDVVAWLATRREATPMANP